MGVSVQVSFYPLGTGDVNSAVESFLAVLGERSLPHEVGAMSTVVWGETQEVFEALRLAYERVAASAPAVMVLTVSNACPVSAR